MMSVKVMVILQGTGGDGRGAHESALYDKAEPFRVTCEIPRCTHPVVIDGKPLCCMTRGEIDNALIELASMAEIVGATVD